MRKILTDTFIVVSFGVISFIAGYYHSKSYDLTKEVEYLESELHTSNINADRCSYKMGEFLQEAAEHSINYHNCKGLLHDALAWYNRCYTKDCTDDLVWQKIWNEVK